MYYPKQETGFVKDFDVKDTDVKDTFVFKETYEKVNLETINEDLLRQVIDIVINNFDDNAEIGRRVKDLLTRAAQ